jgi:uncharacterized membrane protein
MFNIWFFIAALAAASPIPFLKQYTKNKNILFIVLSALSYSILIYAYIQILNNKNITILYPLIKVFSVIIVVIAGILIENEKITPPIVIGILLGCLSIYLLHLSL